MGKDECSSTDNFTIIVLHDNMNICKREQEEIV